MKLQFLCRIKQTDPSEVLTVNVQERLAYLESLAPEAAGFMAVMPRLARLLLALFRDPRVPRWLKALTAGVVSYVALPVDELPDFAPLAGGTDDMLVIMLVLIQFMKRCPEDVLREHWDVIMGDPREASQKIRESVASLDPVIARRFEYLANSIQNIAAKLTPPATPEEDLQAPGA